VAPVAGAADLNCRDEARRQDVRDHGLNGIDDVEVGDDQRTLCVHVFGKIPEDVGPANVRIDGGRPGRGIKVVDVAAERQPDPDLEDCLRVRVDRPGDFSQYTLRLVEARHGRPTNRPLAGFDVRYAQVDFSFKIGCPGDLDCAADQPCPPAVPDEPEISYLAKDYGSFRQLMLDRLAVLAPDWRERHVPDVGVALVEVLAYAGDHLSYYQDAVATEAYLATARRRISVRRHARLVDYAIHEGCNARTWITVWTDTDVSLDARETRFTTASPLFARKSGQVLANTDLAVVPPDQVEVFEPLVHDPSAPLDLRAFHSGISFYTWGDHECCLAAGATTATLRDEWAGPAGAGQRPRRLHLKRGDVLIFEEVRGPRTGSPADADPARRQAVRLTSVSPAVDELYEQPVVEIAWASADALRLPLCISTTLPAPDCSLIEDVTVARGNVLLVDHGTTVRERLGTVPTAAADYSCTCDGGGDVSLRPGAFRPVLSQRPLTFRQPLAAAAPASAVLDQAPRGALPQCALTGLPPATGAAIDAADPRWAWTPRGDLLDSGEREQVFVVETDDDLVSHLRFGDGRLGRLPPADWTFSATYRVGSGPAGNVGADTLTYIVVGTGTLDGVALRPRNPLPARGGTAPEPLAEIRRLAPHAFRSDRQRAIVADDYARLAERDSRVERAAAALRWTGTWYEAQVGIQEALREDAEAGLLRDVEHALHRWRRMGHDVTVAAARRVPLVVEMTVCVLPHHLRGHVEAALLDRFSSRVLSDGSRGFFHPDSRSFGEGVAVSALEAAAQAVLGVASVTVRLRRLIDPASDAIDDGILPMGPMEIAQLDNDPGVPEHGRLILILRGGR
jgi:hypothetical protein